MLCISCTFLRQLVTFGQRTMKSVFRQIFVSSHQNLLMNNFNSNTYRAKQSFHDASYSRMIIITLTTIIIKLIIIIIIVLTITAMIIIILIIITITRILITNASPSPKAK